jgi:hypothetical protein
MLRNGIRCRGSRVGYQLGGRGMCIARDQCGDSTTDACRGLRWEDKRTCPGLP